MLMIENFLRNVKNIRKHIYNIVISPIYYTINAEKQPQWIYLQTYITRNIICQNHEKIVYFYLQFGITHARYHKIQYKIYKRLYVHNVGNFCVCY